MDYASITSAWQEAVNTTRELRDRATAELDTVDRTLKHSEESIRKALAEIAGELSSKWHDRLRFEDKPESLVVSLTRLADWVETGRRGLGPTTGARVVQRDIIRQEDAREAAQLRTHATLLASLVEADYAVRARRDLIEDELSAAERSLYKLMAGDVDGKRNGLEALQSEIQRVAADIARMKQLAAECSVQYLSAKDDLESLSIGDLEVDLAMAESDTEEKDALLALNEATCRRGELRELAHQSRVKKVALQKRLAVQEDRLAGLECQQSEVCAAVYRFQLDQEESSLASLLDPDNGPLAARVNAINCVRRALNSTGDAAQKRALILTVECKGLDGMKEVSDKVRLGGRCAVS